MINLRILTEDGIKQQTISFERKNGGELGFKINKDVDEIRSINIQVLPKTSDDIIAIGLLKSAANIAWPGKPVMLDLMYLPYSRQDRPSEGEPLATAVFSHIINGYQFQAVQVYDPSSQLSTDLLDNCHIIDLTETFKMSESNKLITPDDILIAIGEKSFGKVDVLSKFLNCEFITFRKTIDESTKEEYYSTDAEPDLLNGKNCYVVHDICDTGETAKQVAYVLKDFSVKNLHLFVTHGLFTNGKEDLQGTYDTIEAALDWEEIKPIKASEPALEGAA